MNKSILNFVRLHSPFSFSAGVISHLPETSQANTGGASTKDDLGFGYACGLGPGLFLALIIPPAGGLQLVEGGDRPIRSTVRGWL